MKICRNCIVPLEESLAEFISPVALPFREEEGLCNACYSLQNDRFFSRYFGDKNIFSEEIQQFLENRKKQWPWSGDCTPRQEQGSRG